MSVLSRLLLLKSTVICLFIAVLPAASEPLYDGLIEPSEVSNVSSRAAGILQEILVERGDGVREGQIIARLNQRIETAAVDLARARMEFLRRKVLRNEELHRKQLLSAHDRDEMETELKIAELQLREAEERLETRTIRSPIDGVVVERFLSAGEYIGEEPVMMIARTSPLFVEVVVPVNVFGSIKKGMRARVVPEFRQQGPYTARVVIVDRVIDAASGTFGIRLELPNSKATLLPGLRCKVGFPIPAAKGDATSP